MQPRFDAERARDDADAERILRHRMVMRIEALTSRVPAAIMDHANAERTRAWRLQATKAQRLINSPRPTTKALREALALLEQFE